jgi:hypothetical protein
MGRRSQEQVTGASLEQRVDAAKAREKRLAERKARENAAMTKALLEYYAKRRKELAEAREKAKWVPDWKLVTVTG